MNRSGLRLTNTATLAQRVIVVTGGFGALGRALAQVLARHGARVALLDKAARPQDVGDAAVAVGGVDLCDAQCASAALDRVAADLGRLDGLVNAAGGFAWETVRAGSVATWDRLHAMNVRTALHAAQGVIPHLVAAGRGRIVNVGALSAEAAGAGMGAYAAAKSAVARLTQALAEEFKDDGLTVNAVLPSIIDTPANRADMPHADYSRWVAPEALAEVVAFLLSDAAGAINGALIPVKGRG